MLFSHLRLHHLTATEASGMLRNHFSATRKPAAHVLMLHRALKIFVRAFDHSALITGSSLSEKGPGCPHQIVEIVDCSTTPNVNGPRVGFHILT